MLIFRKKQLIDTCNIDLILAKLAEDSARSDETGTNKVLFLRLDLLQVYILLSVLTGLSAILFPN